MNNMADEELEKLSQIQGETRGAGIIGEMEFIREKEGEEGLRSLEDFMERLGYPMKHNQIKPMSFYPLSWYAIFQLSIKRLFHYKDEDFQEMGRFESKISLIMRLFMKHFVSIDRVVGEVSRMWRKYYTVGEIEIVEINKQEKRGVIRLMNFPLPSMNCQVLKGYFSNVVRMVVGKEVTCQETKCVHHGDDYHEFLLKW